MNRRFSRLILSGLCALGLQTGLVGCGSGGNVTTPGLAGSDTVELVRRGPGGTTRFLGRNVLYRLDPNISLYLTEMNADVILKDPSLPFVPANKNDYSLQIHHAIVDKGAIDLENLLNNYVFNDKDAPLKDVRIRFKDDRLVMAGKMKKGVWVGFEMEGVMEPTTDGKIRMVPKSIRSLGLRVDGLLGLIGLEMARLLKMREEKGLVINGNEIIMDLSRLLPPPTLSGRVVQVGVRANKLHIEMDDGKAKPWPDLPVPGARSGIVMWGGDVLINAVLNLNAHIQLIDGSPQTPMVFALDRYRETLEAGLVVATRAGHLIAYVPDMTSYTADLGRYAPPNFPIPGMSSPPSDIPGDQPAPGEDATVKPRSK